jgi:hypothetical protein
MTYLICYSFTNKPDVTLPLALQVQHIDFENSVFGKTTNPGLSAIKRHFY